MMTYGPTLGPNCKGQTKSLLIFDFKIANPNASHYLSIKPSSATQSFSSCAWSNLNQNVLTPTSQLKIEVQQIPNCILSFTTTLSFCFEYSHIPPPIQHILI